MSPDPNDPQEAPIENDGIRYAGGNGRTPEEAIVIEGARSHAEGIRAVKRYLTRQFGAEGDDWQLHRQTLLREECRPVDAMTVETKGGDTETLYFDISAFFPGDD